MAMLNVTAMMMAATLGLSPKRLLMRSRSARNMIRFLGTGRIPPAGMTASTWLWIFLSV